LIRSAILQLYLSSRPAAAEAFWHNVLRNSLKKNSEAAKSRRDAPVFRIQERSGIIEIIPIHNISAAAMRQLKDNLMQFGQLFYGDPGDKGQMLMFWGGGRFASKRPAVSLARNPPAAGSVEEFLLFARRRLRRVRRVSQQHFPLYLMEIKFRYDHRKEDLFDLLAGAISQLVPDP
jgi:transposase